MNNNWSILRSYSTVAIHMQMKFVHIRNVFEEKMAGADSV